MAPSTRASGTESKAAEPRVSFHCSECSRALRARTVLTGRQVRCPQCRTTNTVPALEREPEEIPAGTIPTSGPGWLSLGVVFVMLLGIIGCSIYANLSFLVINRINYQYFPPFQPHVNANMNSHLGAEYFSIAKALVAGEGFSSPFKEQTGPTAWMPPVLPVYLAGLLWLCAGDQDSVMVVVIITQVCVLLLSGLLVVVLSWQVNARIGIAVAAALFLLGVVGDFRLWFQQTHDCWLVLLMLDLLIVGFAWCRPLSHWQRAVCWGALGGMCALTSPVVGLTWGGLTSLTAFRGSAWRCCGLALLLAGVTLAPWMVRNYLLFGRLIPVKSNASYELWQSQCVTPDGLLQPGAFAIHPYGSPGRQRQLYKELGEMAFLEQKGELFWQSVQADPLDFLDRVACRFLGATLWYLPFNRSEETTRPWTTWTARVLHPLPFLAFLTLGFAGVYCRLHAVQWGVMGVYGLYLLPYVAISYYERYAVPLVAVKALLVIWAADLLLSLLWPSRPVQKTSVLCNN